MTCIVGIAEAGRVHLGGDSAGVGGYSLVQRRDPKVFMRGAFVMGFTSSFRMGQILQHSLNVHTRPPDLPVDEYMVTWFVDAVRDCLKRGGYAQRVNEEESGGTFLVGYQGRLFRIEDDYQVGESLHGYDACGCGQDIARGSLATSGGHGVAPGKRLQWALEAAEKFSAGVRAPFNFISN